MEDNSSGDVLDSSQRSTRSMLNKHKNGFAKGDGVDGHHSNGTNGHTLVVKKKSDPKIFSTMDQEIIRLVAQHLQDLGLSKSAENLVAESGCQMESKEATRFRQNVMSGAWEDAEKSLKDLVPLIAGPDGYKKILFLVREQKYLEYIQEGKFLEALHILRQELTPLDYNPARVRDLSACLMCSGRQSLCDLAKWSGKGSVSRQRLMDSVQPFLPPAVMLPPKRLRKLLGQAVEQQSTRCHFHNVSAKESIDKTSLLVDHECSKEDFPAESCQTLTDHCDEVWFCQFSASGRKLATGSKDYTVMVWNVDLETGRVSHNCVLEGHGFAVGFLAWSPDEKHIAACGVDENSDELVVWDVEKVEMKCKVNMYAEDSLTTCAWSPDSKSFVAGGPKGQFYLCDLDGKAMETWEGVRVMGLAFRPDGKGILASDSHNRIRLYDFDEMIDKHLLDEDKPIMYFSCDRTGRYALLNIADRGVHLWDLEDKVLIRKFQGVTQGLTTISSSFGGVEDKFVASGSEDHQVYIWNIGMEKPILTLAGHTRSVNCVHWNPANPNILASASDDGSVRIWMPRNLTSE